jgi:hypothetical protein
VDDSPKPFRVRYGYWRPLLSVLGVGPAFTGVQLDERQIRVKMGWAFRAAIPRPAVKSVRRSPNRWAGIGAHGRAGRWLVNGSVAGIVTIDVDPPARAKVIGFPVQLRSLDISLEDPDGFIAAVRGSTH